MDAHVGKQSMQTVIDSSYGLSIVCQTLIQLFSCTFSNWGSQQKRCDFWKYKPTTPSLHCCQIPARLFPYTNLFGLALCIFVDTSSWNTYRLIRYEQGQTAQQRFKVQTYTKSVCFWARRSRTFRGCVFAASNTPLKNCLMLCHSCALTGRNNRTTQDKVIKRKKNRSAHGTRRSVLLDLAPGPTMIVRTIFALVFSSNPLRCHNLYVSCKIRNKANMHQIDKWNIPNLIFSCWWPKILCLHATGWYTKLCWTLGVHDVVCPVYESNGCCNWKFVLKSPLLLGGVSIEK